MTLREAEPFRSGWGKPTLNRPAMADHLGLAVLAARTVLDRNRQILATPVVWLSSLPTRTPTRLLIAPQDIRTTDPTVASDIYAGYFAFGGRSVNAHGRSPFDLPPPSRPWAEELHGFGWLRHLRAADTQLARANARALVEDWIGTGARAGGEVAWDPGVVARRLLSWLSQSPLILQGADGAFYRTLMKSIGRQAVFLQRRIRNGLDGEARLLAALALTELGLSCEGLPSLLKRAAPVFLEELGRQILPDGGPASRNPAALVDLLMDLLPLRQAYAARGAEVPPRLLNTIDRIMPALRMFRHADGSLALFNGMGVTHPDSLATVLAHDDARAVPLGNAPHTGYQRLEADDAVAICDTGPPPPAAFSRAAHAGTLAFEFSAGGHRLIVNCGAPDASAPEGRRAARLTAAHSTLVLDDRSSSRFAAAVPWCPALEGALVAGPRAVPVHRTTAVDRLTVEASHDGYARQGFIHARTLTLHRRGDRLTGIDRLVPTNLGGGEPVAFAIRFHLHPAVRVAFEAGDGGAVSLLLPGGEAWLFRAGGAPVAVEESIFFPGVQGPRRAEQLVIHGRTDGSREIAWSLDRLPGPAP